MSDQTIGDRPAALRPDYEFGEAALSGLRLIMRKPKVLPWWIAFNAVFLAAILSLVFTLFGDVFRGLIEIIASTIRSGADADTLGPQVLKLLVQTVPRAGLAVLILFPLTLLYSAIRKNAATRAMLSPDDDRFGYLRIGADEARAMVVILALGIIRFVVQMLFSIGIAGLGAVVIGVQHSAGNRLGAEFLQQFLQLPMYALLIFLFLKFCFALPHTLATKRISIFESWTLTNGQLARLLITYVIAFLIAAAVGIAVGILAFIFVGVAGGSQIIQMLPLFRSDPATAVTQLLGLLPGLIVVSGVVGAISTPFLTAIYYCPAAYIYGKQMGRREDVF